MSKSFKVFLSTKKILDNTISTKVLFLTKYPPKGASSRYRVYQYLPHFKNIQVEVQALMSNKSYQLMYQKGKLSQKVTHSLIDYFKRSLFILRHLDARIVYMQREAFAFGPLWAELLLKSLGKKLVFDLDDALFINKQNQANPLRWDKSGRVIKIIKQVDLVVAGNPWIQSESLRLGAPKAVHIDVAEQVTLSKKSYSSSDQPLKLLWLGSPTTSKYLKLIEQPLVQLQASIGVQIFIVGGDPAHQFEFTNTLLPWSAEAEAKYLSACDVGLMPLPLEDWSKGKCGGKARTYMATGLVPVVSDIGYNVQLIADPERGFRCKSAGEWIKAITHLHHNRALLGKISLANMDYVKVNFDQQRIAQQIEQEILKLIDGR